MIRFVNYAEIFSELGDENSPLVGKVHYIVSISADQVPVSLAYSHKLRLILILLRSGSIFSYSM